MKRKKAFAIFLLWAIWLVSVNVAAASTPTLPDWWFTESYTIDKTERPVGVGLSTSYDVNQNARAHITIQNATGTNLHILAHTIPPGKAVEQPEFEIPTGFVSIDSIKASDFVSYDAELMQYLAPGFIDQNKRAPDRPVDIAIPAPQESKLYILYGEEILTFPIEITYELNGDYNPQNGKGPNWFVMVMFTLIVLFGGFVEWLSENLILSIGFALVFIALGFIRRRRS